jgi:very-short-patch-repair endonuclease
MKRKFLPYRRDLKFVARKLRNNSTLSEVLLWKELKGKQLMGYDFHRQKPIGKFVVDFYCPRLSLAIEIDGESHEGKEKDDHKRQEAIESYGVQFLRFDDLEVRQNVDGVVQVIEEWIRSRQKIAHPCCPLSQRASRHSRGDSVESPQVC